MMRMLHYVLLLITASLSIGLNAAQVSKVRGTQSLLDFTGETPLVGSTYYGIKNGKKAAIVQITKIKGDKVFGHTTKGTLEQGMELQFRSAGKLAKSPHRGFFGGMVGLSRDTMSVQVNNYFTGQSMQSVSLSGTSFSGMGLVDYQIIPHLWFRGLVGIEGFSVAGSSICGSGNTQGCTASLYYLSLGGLARYVFSEETFRPWLGAGLALLFPVSKTSTALSSASISTTSTIEVAGGMDWFITPDLYIPFSLEYAFLPKSDEVTASWIEFRVGVGVPF